MNSKSEQMVTYVWADSEESPRAKARVLYLPPEPSLGDIPNWGYDGSSTGQAQTGSSDVSLRPVAIYPMPIRLFEHGGWVVLCETYDTSGSPLKTNYRHVADKIMKEAKLDLMFGFEQEYVLCATYGVVGKQGKYPFLSWPSEGFPAPQGPYYCGVGGDVIVAAARDFMTMHCISCMEMGIRYFGYNVEVMPGQFEYQIGTLMHEGERPMFDIGWVDHAFMARYVLLLVSEKFGLCVDFSNKPEKVGSWNGTGHHITVSTKGSRDSKTSEQVIGVYMDRLKNAHKKHIEVYGGDDLPDRLTGRHETAGMSKFSHGYGGRDTSIRMPLTGDTKNIPYFEDRRPGGDVKLYPATAQIAATLAGISSKEVDDLPRKRFFDPRV